MQDERDDFVSEGGAIAWLAVAFGLGLMLFLLFVMGLTPAWAGCAEVCRELGTPGEWSQPTDHCCCIDRDETFCEVPTPTPVPTCPVGAVIPGVAWARMLSDDELASVAAGACNQPTPECAEPSPTPLPTPESAAKGTCCREAVRLYRDERLAIVDRKNVAMHAAQARLKAMRAQCQDGDEHHGE